MKAKKKFTLVEVMIVIAIIGLIASMGIPKMIAYRKNALAAHRAANANAFITAVDSYIAIRRYGEDMIHDSTLSTKAFAGFAPGSTLALGTVSEDAIFAYIKGGTVDLEVDGEQFTLPDNLDTKLYVNNWKPYASCATYNDEYTGIRVGE
jgi:prepilin-type N-terminal cleavage/methylation domain-containing protein